MIFLNSLYVLFHVRGSVMHCTLRHEMRSLLKMWQENKSLENS